MLCPHHDIKIVQRSNRQSAVAAAAYQSGERLFSEYDQKQKYYAEKRGIVHTEIMLPPHAPPEYADRNTLWNAAEAVEKQWNSQLARRIVLAIPREIPRSQHAGLIRDYCREFFVSKGMIADFAIHDKGDGNPHASEHFLLLRSKILNIFRKRRKNCICRRDLTGKIQMCVNIGSGADAAVSQPFLNLLQAHTIGIEQTGTAMPLRYNYDKPEKPRISRVFGYLARFFILFQTEKSSREVVIS